MRFMSLASLLVLGAASFASAEPTRTTHIVGGAEVRDRSYPWIASIYWDSNGVGEAQHICGGSLIAARWVLTASHCISDVLDGSLKVKLGTNSLSSSESTLIDVVSIKRHPEFNDVTLVNDIALLELQTPYSDTPISLPSQRSAVPSVGETSTVIGWGVTFEEDTTTSTDLLSVDLAVRGHNTCQVLYPLVDESANVCAGGTPQGGRSTCYGDSGGPLFISRGVENIQVGVVSGSHSCGKPGDSVVFARVSNYYNWISSIVGAVNTYTDRSNEYEQGVPEVFEYANADMLIERSLDTGRGHAFKVSGVTSIDLTSLTGDTGLFVYSNKDFSLDHELCYSNDADQPVDKCEVNANSTVYALVYAYRGSTYKLNLDSGGTAQPSMFGYQTLNLDTPISDSVGIEGARIYQVPATKNITLTSTSGDANLYVFSDENLSLDTLLCRSVTTGLDSCNVSGATYAMVYGAASAANDITYTIDITESVQPQGNVVGSGGGSSGGSSGGGGVMGVFWVLLLGVFVWLRFRV